MLYVGKLRSASLCEVQWLQNTFLKEKVLRENAGIPSVRK